VDAGSRGHLMTASGALRVILFQYKFPFSHTTIEIQFSLSMSGPHQPPSSELLHAPHPQREGGKNSPARQGERESWLVSILDFPSLSAKIPPNYRITRGTWAVGLGGGLSLRQAGSHCLHLPCAGAWGLEPWWEHLCGCHFAYTKESGMPLFRLDGSP
jgi:hypothetical protein